MSNDKREAVVRELVTRLVEIDILGEVDVSDEFEVEFEGSFLPYQYYDEDGNLVFERRDVTTDGGRDREFTTQPATCARCGTTDDVSYSTEADAFLCTDCSSERE